MTNRTDRIRPYIVVTIAGLASVVIVLAVAILIGAR